MARIVEFNSVSKRFADRILIDKVSFQIERGSITTLIGQNGAGKTTIARLILDFEQVSSGKISKEQNIKIGYVPQRLDLNFTFPLTGEGLLAALAPVKTEEKLAGIFRINDFIDYENIRKLQISTLSGGQLQKLILIGTMMNNPDLLILDEPTQFLDVASQQLFYLILNQLKQQSGMTIFMISHDLFTVMKNSDQVICLNTHVCCSGKPVEYGENKELQAALAKIGSEIVIYPHLHDHQHKN